MSLMGEPCLICEMRDIYRRFLGALYFVNRLLYCHTFSERSFTEYTAIA